MLWNSIQSVLSLLIMIGIGWVIAGRAWFGKSGMDVCSKFCVKIAIPCYMFYNVLTTCKDRTELFRIVKNLPIPVMVILVCLGISVLLAFLFRVSKSRRGVFINAVTFSNTTIVGFPVIIALMGEKALSDAMVYYMANTTLFWTLGTWLLRRDSGQKTRPGWKKEIKNIFSPPLVGFLLGVAVVLLKINLPEFLMSSISYVKQSTTALSMVFIGSVIRMTDLKEIRFSRELIMILAGRFVIAPAIMFGLCLLLPVDPQLQLVFCIMTIMPAMTQLGIMAKESGSDYSFASVVITVTTILAMAAIPVYMQIFGKAFGVS